MGQNNPLVSDRNIAFLLYEVLEVEKLLELPAFREHTRETFDLVLQTTRKFAREVLFPAYKPMDEHAAHFEGGSLKAHPLMRQIYPQLVELGMVGTARPTDVGGQGLPHVIGATMMLYHAAGNLSACGYTMLTSGAAHLIEAFGSEELKSTYMSKMYAGRWGGTMALTEPQAGSSLSDVLTRAKPTEHGYHLMQGSKVFISAGDHDVTENIVHLALARIEGAPQGIKGVSLFCVPKRRVEGGELVANDCTTAGTFHKMGWRGIPSIALNFGDNDDCHGFLVGEPHQGIRYMFQMMNEARLGVGLQSIATTSVAYQEALEYARTRPQGRPLGAKDPRSPQVPIVEHADVRRMLLRQKSIVEGALSLALYAARCQDQAAHGASDQERKDAFLLLDLLTPIAKSFPAERGFEANALAVQVHGGYGYTSEYLPEAWLRDQKLNSIHEGTTCMHSMDLLGRKVVADGGRALALFSQEIGSAIARARRVGIDPSWSNGLERSLATVIELTKHLTALGVTSPDAMMRHSVDYLDLFGVVTIAWQWLLQAAVAKEQLTSDKSASESFYRGKLAAAQYWLATELARVDGLASLIRSNEDSFASAHPDWLD